MTKTAKERAKDSDMSKIDAREAKYRAEFEKQGGATGTKMSGILWLLNTWHTKRRPDLVDVFLEKVTALQLMALPEHRHGVAGGIVAIISSLTKREQVSYRGVNEHGVVIPGKYPFKALVDSAHKLSIPSEDVLDLRPGHIDFLWSQWLVLRQDALLNRLVRLATSHVNAEVRQEGTVLLRAHVHLPEIAERLRALQTMLSPNQGRIPAHVPRADVDALGEFLVKGAGLHPIVLVGWQDGEDGGFFVVTPDGKAPPNMPEKWAQRTVRVMKATDAQMEAHRATMAAREEP